MNVNIPQSDASRVRTIKERYSLDLLSATVLERRGARTGEDILYYLENDVIYHHSPFEAEDVPVAVDRIMDAIDDDEKIVVFGDRDVDGVTATAIMVRSLIRLGAKHISYRLPTGDEPYGLTMDSVCEILEKEYTLVITVDCGISCVDEIAQLERNGIDVIVLDHHIAGDDLPPAAAIFDPRVEGAGYPFPGLAGCAVSAKMAWALFFARTPLYGSECIVLHAEPRNGTVRINAVRLDKSRRAVGDLLPLRTNAVLVAKRRKTPKCPALEPNAFVGVIAFALAVHRRIDAAVFTVQQVAVHPERHHVV